ncbi:MAG: hypothetical protein ABIN97_15635, partial [Ginsengibacter sp.]
MNVFTRRTFHRFTFFILTIFFFTLNTSTAQVQQTGVTIKVIDAKREAVPFASLKIATLKDTSQIINKITDSSGVAIIDLSYGQYIISVSSVNYLPFKKGITIKVDHPVFMLMA